MLMGTKIFRFKNIANITADPIRTDSLIVAIKLMKAKHWNGSMFDITNSVMSRLMELSPEKLWGFTESMAGGDLVGERTGGEVLELLMEGRLPGEPAKAVYELMCRLSVAESEVARGREVGWSEKEEFSNQWATARTGAAGRGWFFSGIQARVAKIAGGVGDDAIESWEGGEEEVGVEGVRAEESGWGEVCDVVESGLGVVARSEDAFKDGWEWVRRVKEAVLGLGVGAREGPRLEWVGWVEGKMREGDYPEEAIGMVTGYLQGVGLSDDSDEDADNGARGPGPG